MIRLPCVDDAPSTHLAPRQQKHHMMHSMLPIWLLPFWILGGRTESAGVYKSLHVCILEA